MRLAPLILAAAIAVVPVAAWAALAPGAQAPDFTTRGAIGGKIFKLQLSEQLRKGPVVLYFFPAAFTPGCTLEAREFAAATDDFRKAGATVIGMSADPVDKLADFSIKECASKFAVASAGPRVIEGYDVKLPQKEGLSNRTSYVIAPDGKVIYVHSDMNPRDHVRNTLAAVQKWQAARKAS